jgi:sulfite exporter TauE/SafE
MGIGTALAFIALGAILAFATHFHVSGIDVQMIGWILIFVGVAMLVITLAYTRPRRRRQVVEDVDVVEGRPQPGAFMRAETEPPVVEPVDPDAEQHVRRTVRRDIR